MEDSTSRSSLEDQAPITVDFFKFDREFWVVAVKTLALMVAWMLISSSSYLFISWAMLNQAIVLPVIHMLFSILGVTLIGAVLGTAGVMAGVVLVKITTKVWRNICT